MDTDTQPMRSSGPADASSDSSIFRAVHAAYARSGGAPMSNDTLYTEVARELGIAAEAFRQRAPVGRSQAQHSLACRSARWTQQTMRQRGLLERVPGRRGYWSLTREGRKQLLTVSRGRVLLAFSTRLGVAVLADCRDAMATFDEPIHLVVTSPPYPLAKPRAYGNPSQAEFVDFLCEVLEPVVRRLVAGGSVVLNLSQDLFVPGTPARALIKERVLIALHERLGLHKMDEWVWENPSRPPGPVQWASIRRVQLNATWESCVFLTNDPSRVRADNRRVLEPHTAAQLALIERGGERQRGSYADGAYTLRTGSFANPTVGRIPRNVLRISHNCASQRRYKRATRALGLPAHGAPFPLRLADFAVRFLTEPGDMVVDFMGGSGTTAVAAEQNGCRWVICERVAEYLRGAATRFPGDDLWINPMLDEVLFGPRQHSLL